jgi:hypothetical protein
VIWLPAILYSQEIDTADYRYAASSDCFEAGGADLKLWYKTSTNLDTNGYPASVTRSGGINVVGWDDEAGTTTGDFQNLENNGLNSTLPSYLLDQINGYGVVKFGNNDRLTSASSVAQDILRTEAFFSDETVIIFVIKRGTAGSKIFTHGSGASLMEVDHEEFWWGETPSGNPTSENYFDFSSNAIGTDWEIRTIRVSEVIATGNTVFYVYKNGNQVATKATNTQVNLSNVTANIILGDDANTTDYDISIAEIMVFNYDYGFDQQDLEQVHTHLSLKYGISIEGSNPSYLSWDNAQDLFPSSVECNSEGPYSEYYNRVTGIFRNNVCFDVSHLKSTNYASGAILTGALTHFDDDFDEPDDFERNRTYFLWGDNGESASFATNTETTDVPSTLQETGKKVERIKRKWKVRETYRTKTPIGDVGEVTYEFDLFDSDVPEEVDDASKIWVVVDTDKDGSYIDESVATGGLITPFEWDETTKIGKFKHDFTNCETFSFVIKTNTVPVSWHQFDAIRLESKILLDWSTATEINNSHFEIQHSNDGENWQVLGQQSGNGNSNDISEYSFVDANPNVGLNYYRIKQIDFDGKSSFSIVRTVDFSTEMVIQPNIFPNPANEYLTIELKGEPTNNIQFKIVDLSGAIVREGILDGEFVSISTTDLKEGVYLVTLQQGNYIKTNRFVIAR